MFISSIEKERITDRVESSNVEVDYGSVYTKRNIKLSIYLQAKDTQDYRLLRDDLYDLLDRTKYASETYQAGKLYSVNIDGIYEPERINQVASTVEVDGSSGGLPFAESVATTQDIQRNGLRYGDGWSYGMGLLYDEESHKYTHSSREFRIYNAGNVDIHPFEQDSRIEITGASKGYELKNTTTGDVFKLTDTVNGKVVLDGANITDNNSQALRKTNRKYISLKSGWNEFTQSQDTEVKFDFKYYYK